MISAPDIEKDGRAINIAVPRHRAVRLRGTKEQDDVSGIHRHVPQMARLEERRGVGRQPLALSCETAVQVSVDAWQW